MDEPDIGEQGYVYFVECQGWVKIGVAVEPKVRFSGQRSFNPFPLTVLKIIDGGFWEEENWHKKFNHLRGHGEWFKGEPELLHAIENANVSKDYVHIELPAKFQDWLDTVRQKSKTG